MCVSKRNWAYKLSNRSVYFSLPVTAALMCLQG